MVKVYFTVFGEEEAWRGGNALQTTPNCKMLR
jgi:hypothetical protein